MTNWNWISRLALCVVFTAVFAAVRTPTLEALGSAPGQVCAHIVGLIGEVEVYEVQKSPSGQSLGRVWMKAVKGQSVSLEDRIRTGKGRVRLQFTDRDDSQNSGPSMFNLGGFTEVALTEFKVNFDNPRERTGAMDLIRGTVRNFFKGWGTESGYSIRAGVAVCGIRGTEFTMTHDPDAGYVKVSVAEGQVVLSSPEDARVVKAGQSAAMIRGKFLEQPVP